MTSAVVPVIVAGGSGTRLWPLSRQIHPKQFLDFGGGETLFQAALRRCALLRAAPAPLIVTGEEYRFLAREQQRAGGLSSRLVVLEPEGRGTAAALTLAALLLEESDPVLVMMPADHRIGDDRAFAAALIEALPQADAGAIVALGIAPERPETGYGWLRCGGTGPVLDLLEFAEKPVLEQAQHWLQSGDYLWNSGVFILRASTWLRAIRRYRQAIAECCVQAVRNGSRDEEFFRPQRDAFLRVPADSVDYAVMEHAAGSGEFPCRAVRLAGGWTDLGSWGAVWDSAQRDAHGNLLSGDAIAEDSHDTLVLSSGRLVAALGVRDLVIAETPDAVLVAGRAAAQSVGRLAQQLREAGRREAVEPQRVARPWGTFECFVREAGYVVKRLTIEPGRRLSLQLHRRRAEHWVVVQGRATVQRGAESLTLHRNESLYITPGMRHRLGNDTAEPLVVIEVQTGDYLGEDDIERFDDDFGRSGGPAG